MRGFRLVCLYGLLMLWMSGTLSAQEGCAGALPPRLAAGGFARVVVNTPFFDEVNDSDTVSRAGNVVPVIEGPVCRDGTWQYYIGSVDDDPLAEDPWGGWIAESADDAYLLEPYVMRMRGTTGYPHIMFTVPPGLTLGEHQMTQEWEYLDEAPWYARGPERVVVTFSSAGESLAGFQLELIVWPRAGLAEVHGRPMVEDTWSVLEERPPVDDVAPDRLSTMFYNGLGTDLFAQVAFLDFDGGQGLRFIGAYNAGVMPVFRDYLTYAFQGYTDDYYLQAVYIGVATTVIEDGQPEGGDYYGPAYTEYITQRNTALNAATSSDFTPDLALLDALFTAMRVESGRESPVLTVMGQQAFPKVSRRAAYHRESDDALGTG